MALVALTVLVFVGALILYARERRRRRRKGRPTLLWYRG
jgi:hypothetical protein